MPDPASVPVAEMAIVLLVELAGAVSAAAGAIVSSTVTLVAIVEMAPVESPDPAADLLAAVAGRQRDGALDRWTLQAVAPFGAVAEVET